jgi:PAS domain S-box-containing protein
MQRIMFFNPAAEEMFGISAVEASGQSIQRFIPDRLHRSYAVQIRRIAGTGAARRGASGLDAIRALRADGTEFPAEASISHAVVTDEQFTTVILRDITERIASEEVRTLLAREVDHRAKNALALVQALVTLTRAPTHEAFVEAVEGRVAAIARAHSLLARNHWHGGNLDQIIRDEVAAYVRAGQFDCTGPELVLVPRAVQPISLLIHELATNAVKYGALSARDGRIAVRWLVDAQGSLQLQWREAGGPTVELPRSKGFGSTLISTVTAQQLSGTVNVDYDPAGVVVTAVLPAAVIRSFQGRPEDSLQGDTQATLTTAAQKRRVLVIEDEVLIAMQMKEVLTEAGWTVMGPAISMEQALSILGGEAAPDVAVLDVNLNGELATPLAEKLKDANIPVLLCTGYERVEDDRFAACTLLRKPANVHQLVAGIERAIKEAARA